MGKMWSRIRIKSCQQFQATPKGTLDGRRATGTKAGRKESGWNPGGIHFQTCEEGEPCLGGWSGYEEEAARENAVHFLQEFLWNTGLRNW